ncbi:uncharacterized protein LOC112685411 [Sipha flava]|uniref:Uncharacterized protein LOC112685411 n=1 Tax=Sipha flava TaxID=143950 RepID=A0A8B8FQ48_9HEMI|nr:uncharacterized protein LOC112685411 [Sipha flava]
MAASIYASLLIVLSLVRYALCSILSPRGCSRFRITTRDVVSKEKCRYLYLVSNRMKISKRKDRSESVTKYTFWPVEEEQGRNVTHGMPELASYSLYSRFSNFFSSTTKMSNLKHNDNLRK